MERWIRSILVAFLLNNPIVYAQGLKQGSILVMPDSICDVVFDGENIGHFSLNEVKKIKAEFGEHLLVATFDNKRVLKKRFNINKQEQVIIRLSRPKPISTVHSEVKSENSQLTTENATELYTEELQKHTKSDIAKLKSYLSMGVSIQTTDRQGWSLLHEAASQGDTIVINYCLANKVDVNIKFISPRIMLTPLRCAINEDRYGAVKILLRNHADYGVADGYAVMRYDSGNRYMGEFKDGKRDGTGTFYYNNGDVYIGRWKNNFRDGKGVSILSDSSRYDGDFLDDHESGYGVCVYGKYSKRAGDRYEGYFSNDNFSGKGSYYFANGNRYEGNFAVGTRNGTGTLFYKDGSKYEGGWSVDKRSGMGVLSYFNGDKYIGNWERDSKNGMGTYSWNSGAKYEGNWRSDEQEGKGTNYYSSGAKYTGDYVNGRMNGNGIYYFASGDRYEGYFTDDLRNGEGVFYFVNGDKYEGHFAMDKKDGYGVYTMSSKNQSSISNCPKCKTYKGYWVRDVKNGDGGCYDASGNLIYEGRFINDKPGADYIVR